MKKFEEMTPEEKTAYLVEQNTALEERVLELEASVETQSKELESIKATLATLGVKEETVVEKEAQPIDIASLKFSKDKKNYKFTRPTVAIEENGKFETYTAQEVAEDEALQAKVIAMNSNFIVAVK